MNVPFTVTVESQDANGQPQPVAASVQVVLGKAPGTGGVGALTGQNSAYIPQGTISTSFNVIYNQATTDLVLAVFQYGASTLSPGSSNPVTVSGGGGSGTPTTLQFASILPGSPRVGEPFQVTEIGRAHV